MPLTHPSPANLRAFALGKLPPDVARGVEAHLAECEECTQHLIAAPDDTLVQLAREAATESMYAVKSGSSAASAAAAPPELVEHPRYQLRGPLGSGGMGTVYKAEHRLMERFVALKVIRRGLTSSPQAVERFRREVKAAAKLSHPNIVAALDAEQAGDLHFLVMEYVDGISLDRLLAEKGTLSPQQACYLIHEASKGLAHAHDKGMIHRDIKPQNLMVTRGKNEVKILDFGLARLAVQSQLDFDLGEPANEKSGDAAKTVAGMFLGTPDYIAPEQARDPRLADARSDIYSLGCTLYFLLTGGPPFPKGTAEQKLASHFSLMPTPVTSLRHDVSPELAAVLDRMMAKDPAARYSTVAEVTKALQPFKKSTPAQAIAAAAPEPPPVGLPAVVAKSPTTPVIAQSPTLVSSPLSPRNDAGNRPPWLVPAVGIGGAALLLVFVLNLLGFFSSGTPEVKQNDKNSQVVKKGQSTPVPMTPVPMVPPTAPARPATGKVLFVVPNANVWYADYGPVKQRLEQRGLTVVTAATAKGPCLTGQDPKIPNPPPVVAELSIYDVDPRDYDAILFCSAAVQPYNRGGNDGEQVAKLLADFRTDRKVIGGICLGQAVPASHGLLDGQEAAGGNLMRDKYGWITRPNWANQAVAVADSGRLITGRDDQAAIPFADAVLKSLGK